MEVSTKFNKIANDKKHDEYGFTRFAMAFLVSLAHYNILVENPVEIVNGVSIYSNTIKAILTAILMVGARWGGGLPICFFVLSGYLFHKNYAGRIQEGKLRFYDFIKGKIAKLYPPMILSVIIYTVGQWKYYYSMGQWWTNRESNLWNLVVSLSGLSVGTFVDAIDTINGPIWYISVLMILYIMSFILLSPDFMSQIPLRRTNCYIFVVLVGLAVQYYGINLPFLTTHCAIGYIGFFSGMLLEKSKAENSRIFQISSVGMVVLIVFICVIFQKKAAALLGENILWLGIIAMPAWMTIVRITNIVWKNRFYDFLSDISFYWYLFHIPVFLWMSVLGLTGGLTGFAQTFFSVAGISIIMCVLFKTTTIKKKSYYVVERSLSRIQDILS